MAVFGDARPDLAKDYLIVMTCKPYMDTVAVNATLSLPGYDMSFDLFPNPDNNWDFFSNASAWTMLSDTYDYSGSGQLFDDRIFNTVLIPVNMTDNDPRIGTLDGFFQALIQSDDAFDLEDNYNVTDILGSYIGTENIDNLLDSMQHLYGVVMAQLFNSRQRVPTNSGWSHIVVNGTIMASSRQILYQDARSTSILTALLATMIACALTTLFTSDTKYVVPKNPCSIAAVASLLAGSDLLEVIPPGSEWCNDKELKKKGVFAGYIYSMGWWGQKGSPERRYGIDVGKAEKADEDEMGRTRKSTMRLRRGITVLGREPLRRWRNRGRGEQAERLHTQGQ